jgi:hypothetical protein
MKVLLANAVEVSHNKETFCLIFRFQSPDGQVETVYIVLTPPGGKTAADLLGREIQLYEKEAGAITPWTTQKTNNSTGPNHLST